MLNLFFFKAIVTAFQFLCVFLILCSPFPFLSLPPLSIISPPPPPQFRIIGEYERFESTVSHTPADSSEMTELVQYMEAARAGVLADLWDGVQVVAVGLIVMFN